MTNNAFCNKCGLEYRRSQIIMRMGICGECEPEKFKEQYEKDMVTMQKRRVGQEHITEHTFFPKRAPSIRYQKKKSWHRRETR